MNQLGEQARRLKPFQSPEAAMANINLQSLVQCVAKINGVRATGTGCKDTMRADGNLSAPLLSLPCLTRAEPFPLGTISAKPSVLRAGRSARTLGVVQGSTMLAKGSAYHRKPTALYVAATQSRWQTANVVCG